MNVAITRCPACATRFKVSEAQLEARDGLVRCGRCETVFNAREHLLPGEPSPQLDLPIGDEPPQATDAAGHLEDLPDQTDLVMPATEPGDHYIAPEFSVLSPDSADQPDMVDLPDVTALEDEPASLVRQAQWSGDETEGTEEPARPRRLPLVLISLLVLLLLAQATYFFRNEIALHLPGTKPWLQRVCEILSCRIDLPRDADQLAIESSELEADAKRPDTFILHVLLRNHAPYAQALPSLELTLTDTREQMIARRIFSPADYLPLLEQKIGAIAAGRELAMALPLETTGLRPTGYRLLLFYPRQ